MVNKFLQKCKASLRKLDKAKIHIFFQKLLVIGDENDFYHFNYNPTGISESDYGTVKYNTEISTTVVHWESPDSFFVEFQGQLIGNPIINYSTYSGSDGYGQQLFYVYSDFIGDTLTIYGFTSSDIDSVFVIIE